MSGGEPETLHRIEPGCISASKDLCESSLLQPQSVFEVGHGLLPQAKTAGKVLHAGALGGRVHFDGQ